MFLDNLPAPFRHILILQPTSSLNELASLADNLFFEEMANKNDSF